MAEKRRPRLSSSTRSQNRVAIPGSDRRPVSGAKVVGSVDPNQRIEITLQLRRRPGANIEQKLNQASRPILDDRKSLTRDELAQLAGADPADIDAVEAFAHQNKLTVTEVSLPRRTVKV